MYVMENWVESLHIFMVLPYVGVKFVAMLQLIWVKVCLYVLDNGLWPLLLTWFNFNPSMDK